MKIVPWTLQDYGLHINNWYLAGGMMMKISGIDYENNLIRFSGFDYMPVNKLKNFHYYDHGDMEDALPCIKEVPNG